MKRVIFLLWFSPAWILLAEEPVESAGAAAALEDSGARITRNSDGEVIQIFSGGRPPHSVEELQGIGTLKALEELALNDPQASNAEWAFLKDLPNLRKLTIWHCKTIDSLAPFSGLPIESLTVGGSMGLRDLNRGEPEKHRDAVLSLRNLPNLKSLHLYHTPLVPGDEHVRHIVEEFPLLEELMIDVNAPVGMETTMTPEGLALLENLDLKVLSLENIHSFTEAHMVVVSELESLEAVLIDARKNPFDTAPFETLLREARPELEIVVAGEGSKGPPRRRKGS